MRLIPVLSVLLVAVPAAGAPRPASPTTAGEKSQLFAVQLHGIVQQVNTKYVRPVPVPDLLHAALAGLYEAARLPVPADLKERVDKAAARNELILLIQETHARTADAMTALGRHPMTVACQALFRSLDPFSGVVNKDEQRRNVALDQTAQGVGIDLMEDTGSGPLVIKTVFPGGSAQRAGLRPGDQITHVNGEPVNKAESDPFNPEPRWSLLLESASPNTVGEQPKPAIVTFHRPGGYPLTVKLDRQPYRVETVLGAGRDDGHHWVYWADYKQRIAHIRISLLSKTTPEDLGDVLDLLHDNEMRGLILDLRWTPGGYLDESVEVARMFLGDVPVATVKSRIGADSEYRGRGPSKLVDLPLVVLVNGETSGGAELIAAALQDHGRAVVVGQRTLGKASVQGPLYADLPDVQLKMTTGTFFRPSGKNLHHFPDSKPSDDWGVKPDVEFRISPELGRQLKAWWLAQTLRPGPSLERLPLDDPSADAQRRAALDVVAGLISKKKN